MLEVGDAADFLIGNWVRQQQVVTSPKALHLEQQLLPSSGNLHCDQGRGQIVAEESYLSPGHPMHHNLVSAEISDC